MNSLASAKGPSTALSCPPVSWTSAPAALGARPPLSSSAPAAVASAPRLMIASISPGGGGVVAGRVPWSKIRYRMAESPSMGGWSAGDAAVAINGDAGHPGPDQDDRSDEGQVGGLVAAARRDHGEAGQEHRAGQPAERRPAAPAFGGVAGSEDEAGDGQAGEADPAGREMQHSVPGNRGWLLRCAHREAERRVGPEDARGDQAGPVHADQSGRPAGPPARLERPM